MNQQLTVVGAFAVGFILFTIAGLAAGILGL